MHNYVLITFVHAYMNLRLLRLIGQVCNQRLLFNAHAALMRFVHKYMNLHQLRLTPTLPWRHFKTTNKSEKFEMFQPFFLLLFFLFFFSFFLSFFLFLFFSFSFFFFFFFFFLFSFFFSHWLWRIFSSKRIALKDVTGPEKNRLFEARPCNF